MCNCALSNQSAHDSVFPTQKGKSFVIENFEKGKFHLVSFEHNLPSWILFFVSTVYQPKLATLAYPQIQKGFIFLISYSSILLHIHNRTLI